MDAGAKVNEESLFTSLELGHDATEEVPSDADMIDDRVDDDDDDEWVKEEAGGEEEDGRGGDSGGEDGVEIELDGDEQTTKEEQINQY